ncbi:MAG: RIP metalloprotease RseP [candidate division Zixibacteria bacterium]|nr:RIP metalloprotease RseP [candidate division Zixibacteria bacterium]
MLLTIVSFVFVLGILIFIHELGHFLVAKRVGVRVEKFSLGFPPNIFTRKRGDTEYCIGLIPLGGYVKMTGENPEEETTGAADEFSSKTVGQRAAVIMAGPFMNYLLAIVFLIGIIYFSGKPVVDDTRIIVGEVTQDGPAFNASLQPDDIIIGINGESVAHFDSLRTRINAVVEDTVEITWLHGADTIQEKIVTQLTELPNIDGGIDTVGMIGFSQKISYYERFGLLESVGKGFISAHVIVWETVKFVKKAVTGQVSAKMIGGPVFIAQQSGREARKGAASLFFFMALLSVNLAVLNILPIPILDGGHLVFLLVEKVRGGPLSLKARGIAQQIGLLLLLAVILMVTYNDIMRLFAG